MYFTLGPSFLWQAGRQSQQLQKVDSKSFYRGAQPMMDLDADLDALMGDMSAAIDAAAMSVDSGYEDSLASTVDEAAAGAEDNADDADDDSFDIEELEEEQLLPAAPSKGAPMQVPSGRRGLEARRSSRLPLIQEADEEDEAAEVNPLALLEGNSQARNAREKAARSNASARSVLDALGRLEEKGKSTTRGTKKFGSGPTVAPKIASFAEHIRSQSSRVSSKSTPAPQMATSGKLEQPKVGPAVRKGAPPSPSEVSEDGFSVSVCSEASSDGGISVSVASVTDSIFSEGNAETPRANNRKGLFGVKKLSPVKGKAGQTSSWSSWSPWTKKETAGTTDNKSADGAKRPALFTGILPRLSNQPHTIVEENAEAISLGSSVFSLKRTSQAGTEDDSSAPSVVTSVRSSSTARPARDFIGDIETGGASSSGRSTKGWMVGRKRVCMWASLFVFLALGVVGALVGLDVISMKDDRSTALGIGDEGGAAPSGGVEGSSIIPWYVDWANYRCVQDCAAELHPACGGPRPGWEMSYAALQECCSEGFKAYIDEHWNVDECVALAGEGVEAGEPTAWPTMMPTAEDDEDEIGQGSRPGRQPQGPPQVYQASPTNGGTMFYASWDEKECFEEQAAKMKPWDVGYESSEECCQANFLWDKTSACFEGADGEESDEVEAPAPLMFYAEWDTKKCEERKATDVKAWDVGYESSDECCRMNFLFDKTSDCYAGVAEEEINTDAPTPAPTKKPSQTPTSKPTLAPSEETLPAKPLYRADFDAGKCVQEEATEVELWATYYDSEDECCNENFGWDENGGCFVGAVNSQNDKQADTNMLYYGSAQTKTCTPKSAIAMGRFGMGFEDNGFATLQECCSANGWGENSGCFDADKSIAAIDLAEPSDNPTAKPTAAPIVVGTPTRSPVISPTKSPSRPPTPPPTTAKPTTAPTAKPTVPVPTVAPSPSPTDQTEQLAADLKAASPLSEDSLGDSRSEQYEAIEWLVENANYDTFSREVKVQRWAMATMYNTLYGKEWTAKGGWLQDTSECTWNGITCNAAGMVTSIAMSENGLWGWIPPEVSLLKSLAEISMTKNFIKAFPAEIFSLPNLRVLDLDKNIINEIPSGIVATASSLEELYLSNNEIKTIPDEIFQLKSVKHLWLSNNEIDSSIPSGLGLMTALEELDLESNRFKGSIPPEIYGLANLQHLYLHDNALTGTFSSLFGQMTSLQALDLDGNSISGELPTEIGLMTQLVELHLGDNEIVGQLPWAQLSGLAGLTHLDVSKNYLASTIGAEIGSMTSLVSLLLDNNYRSDESGNLVSNGVQGPIPGTIGNLGQLQELRLDNNFVGGAIPATLGNLQSLVTLRLESNNLQSSLPATLGNLSKLQYLHLWSNYLVSTIPPKMGQLGQLRELFLDDNEITGTIPPQLGQLTSAAYISFADNHLEGVIPPTFGMMSSLDRLDLQFNNLIGEIPPSLANAPLSYMKLEGNYFYGDVPDGVCGNIQYLSGNCETTRRLQGIQFDASQTDNAAAASVPGRTFDTTPQTNSAPTPSPSFEY
ncbi:hypothetical protein ACHAXT_011457 [Thalassiosira profunda]